MWSKIIKICFVLKVLKNPKRPTAKGNYWTVNTNVIPRDLMARQNTQVSRLVQDSGFNYRKDLTDVFDCHSGNIKVNIPLSLFEGSKLIDDPAAIIERLLLEPKSDDEATRPNQDRCGKIYSLVDVFEKENVGEESCARPGDPGRVSFWQESKQNNRNASPKSSANQELPTLLPAALAYSMDSQQLLKMQQTHNASASSSSSIFPSQSDFLAKSWPSQVSAMSHLPLFQAMYNSSLQANGFSPSSMLRSSGIAPSFNADQSPNSVGSEKALSDASESFSDEELRRQNAEDYRSSGLAPPQIMSKMTQSASSPDQRRLSPHGGNDAIKTPILRGLFTAAFSSPQIEAGKLA